MRRVLWALLVVACGHRNEAPPVESASAPVATASAPAPPKPSVILTLRGPGELEIEPNGTSLAVDAKIEREKGGAWEPLATVEPFFVLERCAMDDKPKCSPSDRTMRIVPWTAMTCMAQCGPGCRATVPYGRGPYRVVMTACDGSHAVTSPAFEMDDRKWAAQSTTRAYIARVAQPPKWEGTELSSASTIAGMNVRGDKIGIDDDTRKALAAALDDPKGFDDQIQKRCLMGTKIGFQLTRTLPTTGTQTIEQTNDIVIDFTCQKIFVVRGDQIPRHVHASHFDPSRATFLAITKKYFPDVK